MALAALVLSLIASLAWLFTVAAGVYVGWRYVWKPWNILRADILNLDAKLSAQLELFGGHLEALDAFTRNSRIQELTDEEAASRERRYRTRLAQKNMVVP